LLAVQSLTTHHTHDRTHTTAHTHTHTHTDTNIAERILQITKENDFRKRLEFEHRTPSLPANDDDRKYNKNNQKSILIRRCPRVRARAGLLSGVDSGDTRYLEDCISRAEPIGKILRLLCLLSYTTGGIKPKQYDSFRREFLQVRVRVRSCVCACAYVCVCGGVCDSPGRGLGLHRCRRTGTTTSGR